MILFVIGNRLHWEAARAVAHWIDAPCKFLTLETMSISNPDANAPGLHRVRPSPTGARAVRRIVRATTGSGAVLVIPQDVGLLFRAAVAAARRQGAAVALMPDGAVSAARISARTRSTFLLGLVDPALRMGGVLAGRHGEMGSSKPDLCLSWGEGWTPVWATHGLRQVVATGSPRADHLSKVASTQGRHAVIASQPLWTGNVGGWSTAMAWYRWIESLVDSAPAGQVRVRLHPLERQVRELPIGPATRASLSEGPLSQDIEASSHWFGAASTTLIEAAACGRLVASIYPNERTRRIAAGNPFLADSRMPSALTRDVPTLETALALSSLSSDALAEFAGDYLTHIGSSARMAAKALDSLHTQSLPCGSRIPHS